MYKLMSAAAKFLHDMKAHEVVIHSLTETLGTLVKTHAFSPV